MLFDLTHILYMLISAVLSALLLSAAYVWIKKDVQKTLFLKVVATVTVILHYSGIWVEFFGNGGSTAGLEGSHLLPIYPCHIMMWLLFVTAFIKNKQSFAFRTLAEFCFWGGIVCGTIGILLNENYSSTPDLRDWSILKGLLSHSTLLIGCIYMRVGSFMKIRVYNTLSVVIGLMLFIVDGLFANWLYAVCGLPEVNAMYLLYSPFPSMPWLSPMLMGAVGVSVLLAGLALYELHFPKEERWYFKLKEKIECKKYARKK
ncbi:MAG: hypothetical protein IJX81_00835 [Clostridia bacterium]|nr:hypothetical protein [Clostridia bacterium]